VLRRQEDRVPLVVIPALASHPLDPSTRSSIVVPTLIVFAAFAYVYYKCYPLAAFLWGDAEDWYKKILSQRRLIWSSIIIALAVGILANLFLLGLRSYVRSDSGG
jgi:hypothetical protein